MKLTETTILTAFFASMIGASAMATEPSADVFRAAGCDVETLAPVMSELNPGEVLYWINTNGGGCSGFNGNGGNTNFVSGVIQVANVKQSSESTASSN